MAGFDLKPIPDTSFGAHVTGVRLPDLSDSDFAALYRAWLEYALLIFPGQNLTVEEQSAFADRFGPQEFDVVKNVTNVAADGSVKSDDREGVVKALKGNMKWHYDGTYVPVQAKAVVFAAELVPSTGGETGYADMRAAYDALAPAMKERVENLRAYHSLNYSQDKDGLTAAEKGDGYGINVDKPPLRPLVKIHPETGRKALVMGRHAYGVEGMSAEKSEKFLTDLCDFACQPPRVHYHKWQAGDVLIYDNRCLMHRVNPWDMKQPRIMRHARIAGDPVTELAVG